MPGTESNKQTEISLLEKLAKLLCVIHDEPQRPVMVRCVARDLADGAVGDAAWIWSCGSSTSGWELISQQGLEPDFAVHLSSPSVTSPLVAELIRGQEVRGEWSKAWGDFAQPLAAAGWSDVVVLPIREGLRTVGALAVARRNGSLGEDGMHLLRSVSAALGVRCVRDGCAPTAREEEADRLLVAIEHLSEAIIITDADAVIQYTNPAFTSVSGYSREEAAGMVAGELMRDLYPPEFFQAMKDVLEHGGTWAGRVRNRRKDGEVVLMDVRVSPVRNATGVTTHFVTVQRDISPEAVMEEKLRETQKLEAIGTLAGGIAHDFNNILYALTGYAQLALEELADNDPARAYVAEIARAGERAAGLVTKMTTFGQRSSSGRAKVRIQDVVDESLELARATLPATIEFDLDVDSDCPEAKADAAQIQQMIMNLCSNAGSAMDAEGGTLSVELGAVDVDMDTARRWPGIVPGRWIRLRVGDTGPGMDPAILERIFEPYFTTKKLHEGTGLGLAIVHGIVNNHEGTIHVESELGKGTIFSIFLPLAESNQKVESPREGAVMADDKCRILLIDDEKMIVDMTVRGLARFGFEVTGLTDGVRAVEVFRQDPYGFDAVVTDQTMPQITGFEVAAKLLEIRPDLPVILTSGYNDLGGEEKVREAGIARMLPKPLKLADLARALEELSGAVTK